jgi:transposase
MKRGRPLHIPWQESVEELYELYRREKNSHRRTRLQALWQLRQGKSLTEVHRWIGVSYRTLQRWVTHYRCGGLAEVLARLPGAHAQGAPARLCPLQQRALQAKADTGAFFTIHDAVDWVKARWGIDYSYKGMHYLLRRRKLKKKVPRRQAEKANLAAQEAWKKGGFGRR